MLVGNQIPMTNRLSDTLASHVIAVYRAMEEDATEQEGYKVYVGKLSQLVLDLGISMTYYSKIFRALYQGGYAALEDRGGRNKPSTVVLMRPPEINELTGLTLTDPGPILSLVKRLDALENSLGGVYVAGVLKQIELRLQTIESQIGIGEGSGKSKKSK